MNHMLAMLSIMDHIMVMLSITPHFLERIIKAPRGHVKLSCGFKLSVKKDVIILIYLTQ